MSTHHAGLTATTGREAISFVERLVCGPAVAAEPTVAEGLAVSGQRAAALPSVAPLSDPVSVPLVVHRLSKLPTGWGSFELRATGAQEAAEHCLVARRLTERVGSPGVCGVAPEAASALELVRLPSAAQIQAAVGEQPERQSGAASTIEAAREAFDAVAAALGSPVEPLGSYELEDAEVVVFGLDAGQAKVHAAIDVLRARGARVGALWPRLVRPFPQASIEGALAGRKTLVTADPATLALASRIDSSSELELGGSVADVVGALAAHMSDVDGAPPADADAAPIVLGAPCGPWGKGILREAAALVGRLAAVSLGSGTRVRGAATVSWAPRASLGAPRAGLDALIVQHPSWLDPSGLLGAAREGGLVVLNAAAETSAEVWWRGLAEPQRAHVTRSRLRVVWIDAAAASRAAEHSDLTAWALLGAFFAQDGAVAGVDDAAERLAEALESEGRGAEAAVFRRGAQDAQALDPLALEQQRPLDEIDFRAKSDLPQLPEPVDSAGAESWRTRIQRFHAAGARERQDALVAPLRPALMSSLLGSERPPSFPLVLLSARPDDPGNGQAESARLRGASLSAVLEDTCRAHGLAGRALGDNLRRLEVHVGAELSDRGGADDLRATCEAASAAMATALGLSSDDDAALRADAAKLVQALPQGEVLELSKRAPLALLLAAQRAERAEALEAFRAELETLDARLEERLLLDRQSSPDGRDSGAVSRSLGGAQSLLDPAALANLLERVPASSPLEAARRERVAAAQAEIQGYLNDPPGWILVSAPGVAQRAIGGLRADAEPSARFERVDPCGLAQGIFDGLALRCARLLRAVRVARLEVLGNYLPGLHDEALEQLSWESFTASELSVVPPVVVVTTSTELTGTRLASLLALLRSGRPVRVLVLLDSGAREDVRALDLAYQAVGVREAGVLQSSLARPAELLDGLTRLATSPRPTVAFVEQPRWLGAAWPELWASALLEGREVTAFHYDPGAGETWAERFRLIAPQAERAWPMHDLRYQDAAGVERSVQRAFTFAHVAALVPALRKHLWLIPPEAWSDDQQPIGEFLAAFDPAAPGPPKAIPFLWVLAPEGQLQRAIVSRELAFACRERARLWRVLQELGGARNEHAIRAAALTRRQAEAEAETSREELIAAHQRELEELRRSATQDAVDYLVGALLDPSSVSAAPPRQAAVPTTAPASAPLEAPAEPEVTAEEEAEEEVSFDEAFVDSPLCTTCNECTNLNGLMFKYNGDKQATLADVTAGTFLELVQAAEKCPARCIHPGKPRAGDETVTDELLERAAPFN